MSDPDEIPDETASATPVATFGRVLPARLGRYTLLKKIGAGGMAEVFLADNESGGVSRQVVVKVLFPHLADEENFVTMFKREAQLASRLSHGNIVQVLELGEEIGATYLVMEYIDGISLHRLASDAWRRRRSLPLELCAIAIADAAAGLHCVHELRGADGVLEGLVHRDVSPDNLMVTRDGITKLLDFGIAKGTRSQPVTQTGEIKGKVPFMAPELLSGEEADRRSDIYALGVTFYWLVTGRRPFRGRNEMATMKSILMETAARPSTINEALSPAMDDLIMRMIARAPADRPQTAGEVADALEDFLSARRRVVVPFIDEQLAAPALGPDDGSGTDPVTSGFLPSVPSLSLSGPHEILETRKLRPAAVRPPSSPPTETTSSSSSSSSSPAPPTASTTASSIPALASSSSPARRLPAPALVGVGVAAALALGLTAWFVADDEPPPPPVVVVAPPAVPLVAPPAGAPPVAPPVVAVEAPIELPVEVPTPEPATPSVVKSKRSVTFRGPDHVQWFEGKQAIGKGNGAFVVEGKKVVAVDLRRGARTVVPVGDGVVDYAKLPTGRLQVRVAPYADVFLGKDKLGTTPLNDVPVVAGSYTIKLVNGGQTETRTITVSANEIERITHRFQ